VEESRGPKWDGGEGVRKAEERRAQGKMPSVKTDATFSGVLLSLAGDSVMAFLSAGPMLIQHLFMVVELK
jgi:hypothetical protein